MATPGHLATRSLPFPEIVERRGRRRPPYEIVDTTGKALPTDGMVDLGNRRLYVPLAPDKLHVARHELAHVKWSPRRLPRVDHDPRVLLAVEDARINLGLEWLGIPVRMGPGERGRVASLAAEDLRRGDVATYLLRSVASLGTDAGTRAWDLAEAASSPARRLVEGLTERVHSELLRGRDGRGRAVAPFTLVVDLAAEIARHLDALGLDDPRHHDRAALGPCLIGEATGEPSEARPGLRARRSAPPAADTPVRPGNMELRVAPLVDRLRRSTVWRGGRVWRPSSEGSVVRWAHRYAIDGAIFRQSARHRRGAVLIDTSGSMSLSVEQVHRLVLAAPSATLVAIYSGKNDTGELRIVARDGRSAAAEHLQRYGTGNVVDLPALEWLARQPGRRLWVSDGGVTGVGDKPSRDLHRRCEAVCRRARILRVDSGEEAARILGGASPSADRSSPHP